MTQLFENKNLINEVDALSDSSSFLVHNFKKSEQFFSLIVKDNSKVMLKISDIFEGPANHKIYYKVILKDKAKIDIDLSFLNSLSLDLQLDIHLEGEGSEANVLAVYALSDEQRFKVRTNQFHSGKNSKSKLIFHGVLNKTACLSHKGLVKIEKSAIKSKAYLYNKNIALSKDIKLISIPMVEVLQPDVQCYHGSAIEKIDDNLNWYLSSKGLSDDESKRLLVVSFFEQLFQDKKLDAKFMEIVCKEKI